MKTSAIIILLTLSFSSYAIRPKREYTETPEKFGIKYSEFKLKTKDNYDINLWEYSAKDNIIPVRTIILVGPDAGNMGDLVFLARALREKGIRVVSFDYRGFGHSSDFNINREYLFHQEFAIDLDTVIKAMRNKYPTTQVGLQALSMGTYISLIRTETIDFFIAEGFYNNPQAIVDRIKLVKSVVVRTPQPAITVSVLQPVIPILIFCGSEDKVTTCDDARSFAIKNKVTVVEFNGTHLTGMNVMTKDAIGDLYIKTVMDFLSQNKL